MPAIIFNNIIPEILRFKASYLYFTHGCKLYWGYAPIGGG